ncbi:hypothetical protein AB0D10_24030 [Kitasatospora sp. NPDC048545]|uniref:hypothetical protein n=1 Tax=Kitasatospora sp. NPDC048545 TaxID=3157208 RepID=UPI0034018C61
MGGRRAVRVTRVRARAEELPPGRGTAPGPRNCPRAEELPPGLGTFTVATLGRSFHRTDPRPGGGDRPSDAAPRRRAGTRIGPEAGRGAGAGFTGPQRIVVPGGQPPERTVDDTVAGVFSFSSSAPHLFTDRRPTFETDLRELLVRASPAGLFSERRPGAEVFIRSPQWK